MQNPLRNALSSQKCFLEKGAHIVFVCGKDTNSPDSNRQMFLRYVRKKMTNIHFLLAEDIFRMDSNTANLLSIEEKLTRYSDCIIIILESEGALAELGAFAIKDELCKIILPINDENYKGKKSFINNGPLKKVDECHSQFGTTIYTNMAIFSNCFPEVIKRLDKIIPQRRKEIKTKDLKQNPKTRALLVCGIINIANPIKYSEIINYIKIFGGSDDYSDIKLDIELLQSTNFITKYKEFYIVTNSQDRFINFKNYDYISLKTAQLLYYRRYMPERLKILGEVINNAPQV